MRCWGSKQHLRWDPDRVYNLGHHVDLSRDIGVGLLVGVNEVICAYVVICACV